MIAEAVVVPKPLLNCGAQLSVGCWKCAAWKLKQYYVGTLPLGIIPAFNNLVPKLTYAWHFVVLGLSVAPFTSRRIFLKGWHVNHQTDRKNNS